LATHMDQFHNHFRYEFNRVYTVGRDPLHRSSEDKDVRADPPCSSPMAVSTRRACPFHGSCARRNSSPTT
jgi:hypothetical protein